MILQAGEAFDLDLARSALVGDRETDIQVAVEVGCNMLYRPIGVKLTMYGTTVTVVGCLADVAKFLAA